ncbi:MAG: phytoene/squalene synthase family protein [Thermoflexus sp.]
MTALLERWEHPLVDMAWKAMSQPLRSTDLNLPRAQIEASYQVCEAVIRRHSQSFYWASALLPLPKRRAVRALYAFCRVTDDLVDQPGDDPEADLARWRRVSLSPNPPASEPVAVAWADTRIRYRIPILYAEQMMEAIAWDLHRRRYETFEELACYCYGVASTVGLMSMHIIGFSDPEAIPYAVRLGVALQLTNIMRDIGEDWRMGRLYLPMEELRAFGISEDQIAAGRVDARWRSFMRFQIQRARGLYAAAWPGLRYLPPDGRRAIAVAALLYQGILDAIEAQGYDVFTQRARVSRVERIRRTLQALWGLR